MAATGTYGYDTGCTTDLPLVSITVTDPRLVIGQRIARCWQTPFGGLAAIGGDPNWGCGITQYVLMKVTPTSRAAAANALLTAALRDQEVESGTVDVNYDGAGNMTVNGSFQSAAGPFSVVANVDALTLDVIYNFGQ